jgi:hypothetical protein
LSGVNVLMAGRADHQGLAPLTCHQLCPRRRSRTGLSEIGQLADLVHLHRIRPLAHLAPSPKEPANQLPTRVGDPARDAALPASARGGKRVISGIRARVVACLVLSFPLIAARSCERVGRVRGREATAQRRRGALEAPGRERDTWAARGRSVADECGSRARFMSSSDCGGVVLLSVTVVGFAGSVRPALPRSAGRCRWVAR